MVIRRMLDKWIGLGKKITRDEINWYASIFGERKKELFLRNIGTRKTAIPRNDNTGE